MKHFKFVFANITSVQMEVFETFLTFLVTFLIL